MVEVPDETPVTMPLEFTVAINGFDETHGFTTAGTDKLDKIVFSPTQTVNVPVIIGKSLTVTIAVSVQPFKAVKVIVVLPGAIPVITPLALIVAIKGFEEIHGLINAGVATLDNVVVNPWQTLSVPVIIGNALTVMFSESVQPFRAVKVMVAVPEEIPVTKPLALTVAIRGFEDTHGFKTAGANRVVSAVVRVSQTLNVPVIIGSGLTVMISVSVQPLKPVKVIVVVPTAIPVTIPLEFTVAIKGSEDTHGFKTAGANAVDNVVVKPSQTPKIPVIIGSGLTVNSTELAQPLKPVKVIVAVPAATPETRPLEFTVATKGSEETHGLTTAGA